MADGCENCKIEVNPPNILSNFEYTKVTPGEASTSPVESPK
jgi:hypothetical protein